FFQEEVGIRDRNVTGVQTCALPIYGTYEPLSVTLTHIINNKSGVSFTSYSHTGLPVAVLAQGVNAEVFNGYYDNTDIFNKLADRSEERRVGKECRAQETRHRRQKKR